MEEDKEFIEHVKLFFIIGNEKMILPLPKPTLSAHSSNTTLSSHQMPNAIEPSDNAYSIDDDIEINEESDDEDEDEEYSEAKNIGDDDGNENELEFVKETNKLLQLGMRQLGSPNDLDSRFNFLATSLDDSLVASTPGWSDNFELHNTSKYHLHTSGMRA